LTETVIEARGMGKRYHVVSLSWRAWLDAPSEF
jgi:hypothetical protein